MPKLVPDIAQTVFFLFGINPKTGELDGPLGTGFLVARDAKKRGRAPHYYAVSNWHVTQQAGASIIRINTTLGPGHREIHLDPSEWQYSTDDDISVADVTGKIGLSGDQISVLKEVGFVTRSHITRLFIEPGADTFMCGLFANHDGGKRNIPSFRFGNLSMLANDGAPIDQETGAKRPAHLVDTRSRTGFSGSPVFVYQVPEFDLSSLFNQPLPPSAWQPTFHGDIAAAKFMGLLGIHCGQFPEEIEVEVRREATRTEKVGDKIEEGDTLVIPSSMTIVVPAWIITEMIDRAVFRMARDRRESKEIGILRRPRPEAAGPALKSEPPATPIAGDDRHKERFTALLDEALGKPKPAG